MSHAAGSQRHFLPLSGTTPGGVGDAGSVREEAKNPLLDSENGFCDAESSIAPPGTRTPDPLIKSQQTENGGTCNDKDLRTPDEQSAASGAAHDPKSGVSDPDLTAVVEAWPDLPEHVRATILTLIRSTAE
jgi:hypothetical protein